MHLFHFSQTVMGWCWSYGTLFAIIGLINFSFIPWRSLRPETSKCEPIAAPNGGPAKRVGNSRATEGPPAVS